MDLPMMLMGMGGQQPQPQPQPQNRNDQSEDLAIPARVRFAMSYLAMLNFYAQDHAASAAGMQAVQVEVMKGLDIDLDNCHARKAACEMLAKYFGGELVLYDWEKMKEPGDPIKNGNLIHCFNCRNGIAPNGKTCPLCCGTGSLLVHPSGIQGQ